MYVAPERLYLTRDGRIVREGDPNAHQLFVAKGGYVPFQLAKKYGLGEPAAEGKTPAAPAAPVADQQEQKARSGPPKTKHRAGPPQTK